MFLEKEPPASPRIFRIDIDGDDGKFMTVRTGQHPDIAKAPFPMCFTHEAMRHLLVSVGRRLPGIGGQGFWPGRRYWLRPDRV